MKTNYFILLLSFLFVSVNYAQTSFPPVSSEKGIFLGETLPLRDYPTVDVSPGIPENLQVIPMSAGTPGRLSPNALPANGQDPIKQTTVPYRDPQNLLQNFDGAGVNEGQAIPPDPTGAVGPNHYVHAVNLVVKIFDKQGGLLAGPTFLGVFLGSGVSNGDPIVMYDQLADRYFVSQFRINDDALIIGVSTSPDPTGSYFVYQFPLNSFPDYPHYSVWPNAYILGANKGAQVTYVMDREKMLAGEADPEIKGFFLPSVVKAPGAVFGPQPVNLLGTDYSADVPGYIVYLQDDAWSGTITEDHVKIWEIDIDFDTPGGSSISAPDLITTAAFDSFFFPFGSGDVNQPGTSNKIDNISRVVSYMSQYRSFPTHNSILLNFNVNLGTDISGIRWIELRQIGAGPFTLFQEGTWTLPDGENRFMGSMAMDEEGNIGLAYNIGSAATNAGIRYTGRMDGDPLGTMTFPETSIIEGSGIQTNTNRFGDYAHLTMDMDNRTFWHTSEYFSSNNFWRTRIASFKFIADVTNDVGAYAYVTPSLSCPNSASETIEASLFNFGTAAQSNFDVELLVDGALVATETFTGTINPSESATYAFTQTVDMSTLDQEYEIEVRTLLGGDEFTGNDEVIRTFSCSEVLGVGENAFIQSDIIVYPAAEGSRTYNLDFNTALDFGDVSYKVIDILGKEYALGSLANSTNGYRATVDMNAAAAGIYIVQVTNGNYTTSQQVQIK